MVAPGINIGQMIFAPETHFRWVKDRIIAAFPSITVKGIVDALDWPPKEFEPNTFYMKLGEDVPHAGFGTIATMGLTTVVQWAWMVPGDDLQVNQIGRNRGGRFRTDWQMKAVLMYGLFPYYCPKQSWQVIQNGNTVDYVGTAIPGETIWWSRPRFGKDQAENEKKVGILYDIATIGLSQFGDTIQTSTGLGG